jgi:chorismate mutase/prephenate dehydratase
VGREGHPPTGSDKTSVLFVAPNAPGALYRILKPLDDEGVNVVKLESRPLRQENWSHLFFADLEGHLAAPAIADAVGRMQSLCLHLKVLGSYPAAAAFDTGERERG